MPTVQRGAQIFGVVFILFGIAGFFATGMSMEADVETAPRLLGLFPVNLVLAVLGFIAPDTFGLIPIGGNDIWLHAILGVALLALGLTARATTPVARTVA